MNSNFRPAINISGLKKAAAAGDFDAVYDLLAQPLHEELYRQGSFAFMSSLSQGQQLLLAYDYVRMQVGQGGFIQFIQNGYIALLPDLIGQLHELHAGDMALVLDDVLKVYVLNRELLAKETTVQEFAQLYNELKEFEVIEARYDKLNEPAVRLISEYALQHLDEFCVVA